MTGPIGRYRIIGELGRGAMGVVYHATDPAIGRSVAIKTIRIQDIDDPQQRERLRERLFREARSAGVLSHPNIVTIYDMDEVDGLAYIAMAYVNGPTLEKVLASEEPLSGAKMLRILRQAALALDYAHTRNIIHRDVKPANIMTDEDGSVKITDFGIARITAGIHATDTKTIAGTPNYMSPEQVQGLPVDGRSDQFSLAVIAYEILTGERPFTGEHLSTIVYKIVADEPPSANHLNGTLTPRIDEVLRKALSKKPEDRFPNCSNFVGALELACAESRGWKTVPAGASGALPTIAVEPPHEPTPPRREPEAAREMPPPEPRGRSRILPLLTAILLVAGAAAILISQYGPGSSGGESNSVSETARTNPKPEPLPPPVEENKPVEEHKPEEQAPKPSPNLNERPVEPVPVETVPVETVRVPRVQPEAKMAQPRMQDVWVTTNPPGAKAVLDGNVGQVCSTPCMLHGTPGVHHLTILQTGYMSEYRDIQVGDTAMDVPQISLRQPMGTLLISSKPAGANIRINGQPVPQLTPAELSLKPGPYSVTVEKGGASKTENIDMGDNLIHLSITLTP